MNLLLLNHQSELNYCILKLLLWFGIHKGSLRHNKCSISEIARGIDFEKSVLDRFREVVTAKRTLMKLMVVQTFYEVIFSRIKTTIELV